MTGVEDLAINPKDIQKLMKGELTIEEYARKYNMKIEHVKNFKNLFLIKLQVFYGDYFAIIFIFQILANDSIDYFTNTECYSKDHW